MQVSKNMIRKILDNLNVFKTLGPEEMYIEILKWLNTISVCQLSLKNHGKLGDARKLENRKCDSLLQERGNNLSTTGSLI